MKRFPMVEHIEQKLLQTGLTDGAHALRLLLDWQPVKVIQRIPIRGEKMRVALFYQRIKNRFLAAVIAIQCPGGNASLLHNSAKRGCLKALFQKLCLGGIQNFLLCGLFLVLHDTLA